MMWRGVVTTAVCLLAAALGTTLAQAPNQINEAAGFQRFDSIRPAPDLAVQGPRDAGRAQAARPMPVRRLDPAKVMGSFKKSPLEVAPPRGQTEAFIAANPDGHSNVKEFSGNIRAVPLAFAGKFVFTTPNGDAVCSAQLIAPRLLLTAAHCVQDEETGQWFTNFEFFLQYHSGQYSQAFGVSCVGVWTGWHDNRSPDNNPFDYAISLVDRQAPGWFGTAWNWAGSFNAATKIGYPGGIANGEVIQVDNGRILLEYAGVATLQHGDRAPQEGTSGGGWVANYSPAVRNDTNYILSVSSFVYADKPGVIYGPYFTDDFHKLSEYAARGCR
jgi:hypothetical protein